MKIYFADFWGEFPQTDNYFYNLLRTRYDVEIDSVDPDIVFFSVFGEEHKKYKNHRSKKVFFTGENRRPPTDECDLSFSFDATSGKNVYLPLWVLFLNWFNVPFSHDRDISYLHDIGDLTSPVVDIDSLLKQKTNFCSFIVKNPNSSLRVEFCKHMQTRARVDCPGDVLNNCSKIGGRGDQRQKIDFLKSYRFNIAFENSFHPGYVTEKIIQPMFARCVPIYWGGTEALKYFNKNSFIWCGDCENMDQAIDHVLKIENDKDLYIEMIRNPVLNSDVVFKDFDPSQILNQMSTHGILNT
jgi:hypothetical protein